MSHIWRRRPSPAMVVACAALALALGGTSYATVLQVPRNSVGTAQLKNNAVTSTKVRNGSLLRADFGSGQIPAGPAGPAGPSDAFARVINGPITVPATGPFLTLANLSIPQAGRYVLWAKAGAIATTTGELTCLLVVGNEQIDQMTEWVPVNLHSGLALLAARDFPTAGSVDLRCAATGVMSVSDMKMVAIKVGSLMST
ncbi:MAG: hypothetical protein ACRDN6_11385 [Gaiellaceae bacterium]